MRRLIAAGISDIGRVRTSNEDAYLAGDSVYAVADGMGGHVAGEVAASTALEPIAALEGKIFADSSAAVTALRAAVVEANDRVTQMAEAEPSYHGMGTTLTAVIVEGQRLHVAHVGDSRAYLLRDGQFSQLTDDHTLVQHLVNEGQITLEEAAQHPQRSIITRAIGVSHDIDVDSMTLELLPDDVLLLCSDGLTGVVGDATIAGEINRPDDPSDVVARLVKLANDAGGPDNVTAILLRYEDPDAPRATAPRTITIRPPTVPSDGNWIAGVGATGSFGTTGSLAAALHDPGDRSDTMRIVRRIVAIVFAAAVVVAVLVGGARFLLSQNYFVGLEDDTVVIYQGLDVEFGPLDLATVVVRTDLVLDDIPAWYHPTLEAGRPAADLNDAQRIVAGIPRRDDSTP
ncbi:MAG: Stp1/IreP family PP2C-type Ser/Thr phosphatase [Nitriliruptoraceae bacterium]